MSDCLILTLVLILHMLLIHIFPFSSSASLLLARLRVRMLRRQPDQVVEFDDAGTHEFRRAQHVRLEYLPLALLYVVLSSRPALRES